MSSLKMGDYAVLFAPQCGQNVAVWGKSAPQYLQGIKTTSRITSLTSLLLLRSLEPHPQPNPKGNIFSPCLLTRVQGIIAYKFLSLSKLVYQNLAHHVACLVDFRISNAIENGCSLLSCFNYIDLSH